MLKFCIKGDNSANPFYSSSIIITKLNEAAKKVGLYDEQGKIVVYSTTCNDFGHNTDAFLCVYETTFPIPVLQLANGRPILGCSLDNLFFINDSYPASLCGFSPLGVDTEQFNPQKRIGNKEVFRFLAFCESNARSGLDEVLKAFGTVFRDVPGVELYIKDRGATDTFKEFVKQAASSYRINVIHDTENTQSFEDILKIYAQSDCLVFCSKSTTWGMPILEAMACGLPVISTAYAGPREYLSNRFNSLIAKHNVVPITQQNLDYLAYIGCRNHMFPLNAYPVAPYWSEVNQYHLQECMVKMRHLSKSQLNDLGNGGIMTARHFTWERAAVNLSNSLEALDKNKSNPLLWKKINRYE